MKEFHAESIVISEDGAKRFQPLDPQNNICANDGKDMQINNEPCALEDHRDSLTKVRALQLLAIAYHDP